MLSLIPDHGGEDLQTERLCTACGRMKTLSEFAVDRWRPDGRRSRCTVCRRDYDRERDYIRRSFRYGYLPLIGTVTTGRLTKLYGDGCFYCNAGPFECIDHRISVRAGGAHTVENVVPCCSGCNTRKWWSTDRNAVVHKQRLDTQSVGERNNRGPQRISP